jgi:hypothetical protein
MPHNDTNQLDVKIGVTESPAPLDTRPMFASPRPACVYEIISEGQSVRIEAPTPEILIQLVEAFDERHLQTTAQASAPAA